MAVLRQRWWLLVSSLLQFGSLCAAPMQRFAFEKAEMGLPVRVTLYCLTEAEAAAAAEVAFARIEELNAIFSDYDSDSELSRLSDSGGQGRPVSVSRELWEVLTFAEAVSQRSGGAFDLTVGPVVNLWRTARRRKELPSRERLAEALSRTGFRNVLLDPVARSVELCLPRMRLDAGGIAKGYALEEALNAVRNLGFKHAMVEGGGDMALGDPPPGEAGWRVEIVKLDADGAPAAQVFQLSGCSVSTSGDMYQRLEIEGKRYSHIVDPWTGIGLTDHSLVTVVSKSGMEADALSKVVAVLGPELGFPIIEERFRVVARVVRPRGGGFLQEVSRGWDKLESTFHSTVEKPPQ